MTMELPFGQRLSFAFVVGSNSMSSNFVIIPRRPEAAPKDTAPAALAQDWFDSVRGIAPETVARLREQVQSKLETGACRHLLPNMPAERLRGIELQRCLEQVIME